MTDQVTMYGADWCRDCLRSKAQLDSLNVEYRYINLVEEPDQADAAHAISGRTNIPVIVFNDGTHLVEPSNNALEEKLEELGLI